MKTIFAMSVIALLIAFAFAACNAPKTNCDKAKDAYNKVSSGLTMAQALYDAAVAAANQVCGISAKTKSLDMADACAKAKQVENAANIALGTAQSLVNIWKTEMDLACGASK